jgi:uncharacterized protein YndB with AHSA1/START domain
MTEQISRSIEHATFTLHRVYPATKAQVFAAFADKEKKARWFGDPGDNAATTWDMDFREGGREYNSGEYLGETHTFDAEYLDIVEDERITWSYNMYVGGVKLSSSLTVVELTTVADGTRITFTETGAYFDGHEKPALREEGTSGLLDALGASLGA